MGQPGATRTGTCNRLPAASRHKKRGPKASLSVDEQISSTTGALAIHLGQQFLADTDALRSDFNQFVVVDEPRACSSDMRIGGVSTWASSVPEARMLVSCLPFRQFTVRSLERE